MRVSGNDNKPVIQTDPSLNNGDMTPMGLAAITLAFGVNAFVFMNAILCTTANAVAVANATGAVNCNITAVKLNG